MKTKFKDFITEKEEKIDKAIMDLLEKIDMFISPFENKANRELKINGLENYFQLNR